MSIAPSILCLSQSGRFLVRSRTAVVLDQGISRVPGNEQRFILLMQVTRSGAEQRGNGLALISVSGLPALPPRPKRCSADAALSFILASIYRVRTLSTRSNHATSGLLDITRSSCHCVYLQHLVVLPECV